MKPKQNYYQKTHKTAQKALHEVVTVVEKRFPQKLQKIMKF